VSRWSAVFLDRDGTVNVKAPEGEYVAGPGQLVLLPGAGRAVRRLGDAGIPVFIVTNQRGVARGVLTAQTLDAVHDRLRALLSVAGGETTGGALAGGGLAGGGLAGIYSCVHETGTCDCRKPQPGLLHQVVRDHPGIDLTRSALVGDAASDIAAGTVAGCTTVRLAAEPDPAAAVTVGSLAEAADWLLR
jgi:D-glycero-D-manno-heptose 1,7-bisphosphate phosphatase